MQIQAHKNIFFRLGFLFLLSISALVFQTVNVLSQTSGEVQSAIEQFENGEIDGAKAKLTTLVTKYQNDAGVLYLQARVTSNAIEASQYYQTIVNNFPKSEWADDALYRLYQYYYTLGLYRTANAKLLQLKKDYPQSSYVTNATQVNSLPANAAQQTEPATTKQLSVQSSGIEEEKPQQQIASSTTFQERFTLQVGAFSTSVSAEKQKSYFEDRGYRVEVANKMQNGKSLYKVWVGAYKNRDEAQKASREVKSKYRLESMVIERN